MKIILIFLIVFSVPTTYIFGQNQMTVEDPFEDLIASKTKYNASIGVAERWKYQTFSGSLDAAKNAYVEFRKAFRQIDATIVFAQPNYKVWSGNTRTRLECERLIDETKKKFPSSFLVKPKN